MSSTVHLLLTLVAEQWTTMYRTSFMGFSSFFITNTDDTDSFYLNTNLTNYTNQNHCDLQLCTARVPRTEVMTVATSLRTFATLVQFTLIIIKNLRIREFEIKMGRIKRMKSPRLTSRLRSRGF